MVKNRATGTPSNESMDLGFVKDIYLKSQIGFYRTTPDGKVIDANPAMVKLLGYESLSELKQRNLEHEGFLTTYSRKDFKDAIAVNGEMIGYEDVWINQKGKRLYVRENAKAIYNDDGDVLYYDGSIEDITEKKNAQLKEKHASDLFNALRKINKLIVSEKNAEGLLNKTCQLLSENFGYTNCWIMTVDENDQLIDVYSSFAKSNVLRELLMKSRYPKCLRDIRRSKEDIIVYKDSDNCRECLALDDSKDQSGLILTGKLHFGGNIFGYIIVSLPVELAYSEKEREFFAELTTDISFALHKIHLKKKMEISETNYRLFIETANEAIIAVDKNGVITFVNDKVLDMLGYERHELLGKLSRKFIHKEDLNLHQSSLRKLSMGQKSVYEKRLVHKDGSIVWTVHSSSPVYDESDNFSGAFAMVADITPLKKAEASLKAKTKQLQTFFSIVPDYLLIMDTEFTIIKVSNSWQNLLGYPVSQIEGKKILEFIHPEDKNPTKEIISELIKHKTHNHSVNRYKTKSGYYRYMEWFSQVYEGVIYAIARDVTDKVKEQKIMDQIITSSQDFLLLSGKDIDYDVLTRRMLNMTGAVAVGFNLHDRDTGDFQTVAIAGVGDSVTKAEAIFGRRIVGHVWQEDAYRNEKIAGSMTTFFPSLEYLTRDSIGVTAVAALEKMFNLGSVYIIKVMQGKHIYGDFTILMPKSEKIDFQHLIEIYARQVALLLRRANVEHVLSQNEEELQQASKMDAIGRLAGGIAHDFNNMLHAIMGYTEMAIQVTDDHQKRLKKYLHQILKIGEESSEMTKQLLAFAKKQNIVPVILDLTDIVTDTRQLISQIVGKKIELISDSTDRVRKIKIDPTQFKQVLVNLIINARDAVKKRPEGKIKVVTDSIIVDKPFAAKHPDYSVGAFHTLIVEDNGCGMNNEITKNIFEPFYTTKSKNEGTGLGLSTVYGIVKQNKGFITVNSVVNQGSVFTVFFPAVDDDKENGHYDKINDSRKQQTVLLVEDDKHLLDLIKEMITLTGRDVLVADHPQKALNIYKNNQELIDILVTDIAMPEIDGKELWLRLKKSDPNLKCLFISGYTADVLRKESLIMSECEFLQKPFTINELEDKLNQLKNREYL